MENDMSQQGSGQGVRTAQLYRMVMEEHLCPIGLKSKDLLERKGFDVEDHHLTTREETEAFKGQQGVDTTPQIFIDGRRIGGYDELRTFFGLDSPSGDETTYKPVIALFVTALMMGLAVSWTATGTLLSPRVPEYVVAIAMTLLGLQKLKDVERFSTMFLNYDLLAQRHVRYGYIYPYAETAAGILMLAGALVWLAAPVALFIGAVGAVSVFKAVYLDKRELKCACVGGDSQVPLGFISLTENLIMIGMGIWMPLRMYGLS
jgi:glutaredoxin